jgi:NTP pyrophosphatase (non-canonical NTP hydrolase)
MNHFTPTQELIMHSPQNDEHYKQPLLAASTIREAQTNYLLDKLQEESAEVIQAVSKIRRFGVTNKHPDRTTTNLQDLINELEDLLACIAVLESLAYFDLTKSKENITTKAKQLLK